MPQLTFCTLRSANLLTCIVFVFGQKYEPEESTHTANSETIDVAFLVDVTGSMACALLTAPKSYELLTMYSAHLEECMAGLVHRRHKGQDHAHH